MAATVVEISGTQVGLSICEDAWYPGLPFDDYRGVPIVANLNGSPYHRGKADERLDVLRARAAETGAWIVYVNAVGGQDELVFDGGSLIVAPDGSVPCRAARFDEDLLVATIEDGEVRADERPPWPEEPEDVYRALQLGTRDYVRKNGFTGVVLGLSGGIDSALVATIAADALGPDAVHALGMPSMHSSSREHRRCRRPRAPSRHHVRAGADHRRLSRVRVAAVVPRSCRASPPRTCRRGSAATT